MKGIPDDFGDFFGGPFLITLKRKAIKSLYQK
jgi:hypothetical protein